MMARLSGRSHPTSRVAVDKRLAAIAAGRGLHKPTAAHPFALCFGASTQMHFHYGDRIVGAGNYSPTRYAACYGPRMSCAEFIAYKTAPVVIDLRDVAMAGSSS